MSQVTLHIKLDVVKHNILSGKSEDVDVRSLSDDHLEDIMWSLFERFGETNPEAGISVVTPEEAYMALSADPADWEDLIMVATWTRDDPDSFEMQA